MKYKEQMCGVGLVLLAGCSWGIISIFIRHLAALGLDSMNISALRSLSAALVFAAMLVSARRWSAFKVKLKDIWCLAGCGVASIALFNILYFSTMQRTTVGIAVILLYTSPIFVTLLSCLIFGERFTLSKFISLVSVMVGCILVSGVLKPGQGVSLSPAVFFMGIGSGLCYGLFSIFGRLAQNRGYSSETITLWSFIFSGAALSLLLDFSKVTSCMGGGKTPVMNWLMLLGLVCISTLLPYFSYSAGLKRLQPSTAAIAANVEVIVGSAVGILVFDEPIYCSFLIGSFLILLSVVISRVGEVFQAKS